MPLRNAFENLAVESKQDVGNATLSAIQSATNALLVAANAIKVAAETLNTKTTAVNTGAVAGTVAVSNLPATQPVSGAVAVSNFPATQPISGGVSVSNFPASQAVTGAVNVSNFPATQPVSGSVSVTGAVAITGAGDATAALQAVGNAELVSIDDKLPALLGGRIPVVLPAGGGGLTDAELRASPLAITTAGGPLSLEETQQVIAYALNGLLSNQPMPDAADRNRVVIEAISGGLTLAAVTTVSTVSTVSSVTNLAQIGALSANDVVRNLAAMPADTIYQNIRVT